MKIEVRFEPVETDKLLGQTLADVEPWVMVKCWIDPSMVLMRYHDGKGNVWGIIDGKPVLGWGKPESYTVGKILGPVLTSPPEKPPEPPAIRLDELDQQVWVMCYRDFTQDPNLATLRCHDGTGRVFGLNGGDVPFLISAVVPSNYIVVGKPIGQLRIRVTDDGI